MKHGAIKMPCKAGSCATLMVNYVGSRAHRHEHSRARGRVEVGLRYLVEEEGGLGLDLPLPVAVADVPADAANDDAAHPVVGRRRAAHRVAVGVLRRRRLFPCICH